METRPLLASVGFTLAALVQWSQNIPWHEPNAVSSIDRVQIIRQQLTRVLILRLLTIGGGLTARGLRQERVFMVRSVIPKP